MRHRAFGLVLLLACLPLAACNQQHATKKEARYERKTDTFDHGDRGDRGRRGHGLRRACADDLQKYCAGQERGRARRDCLQSHLDQLSSECKSAVEARGGRRHRGDDL